MKQAADKFTGDLFEVAHASPAGSKPMYRVFLTTTDGIVLVWTHLTRTQAVALHNVIGAKFNVLQSSTELVRFGWEEMV